MIRATEITRSYGRLTAVDHLSFDVPEGVVCGFLGPNGAGKSTTIRMIAGLFPPDSGRLTVGGVDVRSDPLGVRRQVGYLPETSPLYPEFRLEEYLRFRGRLAGLRGRDLGGAVDKVIDTCGLGAVRRRLVRALSRGFRQRTGLAAALIADPPLLVLDEPTVGLDPAQQGAFRALLSDLAGERTVLLSSHLLAEVEASCSWLVMISDGKLIGSGTRDSLLHRGKAPRVLAELATPSAELLGALLRKRSDVHEVVTESIGGEWTMLLVTQASTEVDLRATIGSLAAKEGIGLRELRFEERSLETVYLELAGHAESEWKAAKVISET